MTDLWHPLTQQRIFRRLMTACAYPGRLADLSDSGATALSAVLATLLDGEVSLADPNARVAEHDWPRLEARRSPPETADFIVCDGAVAPPTAPAFAPRLGTLENPERSATLILCVAQLSEDTDHAQPIHLEGPGIEGRRRLAVTGLDPAWLSARADWVADFPLGLDCLLVDPQRAVFLPRTTQIIGEH
jgi:alpha-D-ribose 1-methylphosphonate 5-triphosphate synthase subunit PhnH